MLLPILQCSFISVTPLLSEADYLHTFDVFTPLFMLIMMSLCLRLMKIQHLHQTNVEI